MSVLLDGGAASLHKSRRRATFSSQRGEEANGLTPTSKNLGRRPAGVAIIDGKEMRRLDYMDTRGCSDYAHRPVSGPVPAIGETVFDRLVSFAA